MSSFGLPPLPLPLKSISPYLQRAAELHQKDPVIAYWCAYYAAQVGISLKAKDNASRTLLLELLDVLEKLKRDIGPNDAIDTESASAAYVENFALRVFSVADDEDRSGNSTRYDVYFSECEHRPYPDYIFRQIYRKEVSCCC